MTATVDQVVAKAASQIGYYEKPGGARSIFEAWYLMSGYWCAMGLSWVFDQVGALDIFPKHAYTPTGVQWFKRVGRWTSGLSGVRRGDIVFFDFPGAPARVSHVGIVESVNADGSVNTIEFNTSVVVGGNQRNGGSVARKRRKAYITGYGRPAYSVPVVTPGRVKPKVLSTKLAADGNLLLKEDGLLGSSTIARWQQIVNAPVTGIISHPSSLIVAVQRVLISRGHSCGRTGADGDFGPATIGALQNELGTPRDGVVSRPSSMVRALQIRLNHCQF